MFIFLRYSDKRTGDSPDGNGHATTEASQMRCRKEASYGSNKLFS